MLVAFAAAALGGGSCGVCVIVIFEESRKEAKRLWASIFLKIGIQRWNPFQSPVRKIDSGAVFEESNKG
jgi:hypothetical protein